MDFILTTNKLSKRYGSKMALDGLDMHVPRNKVYGLLGVNGAGKTTTFGILGKFIHATSGSFDAKGKMSILPQDARFYGSRTLMSQLRYFARLSGIPNAGLKAEVERVLGLVGLLSHKDTQASKISHGMYKRLGVAQALLGDPEILLLDEPTSGLDPENAAKLRELLARLGKEKTIVISSHNLAEIANMCDLVGVIHEGKMVYEGPIEHLTQTSSSVDYFLDSAFEQELAPTWISRQEWDAEEQRLSVSYDPNVITLAKANAHIIELLKERHVGVLEIRRGRSLEESFIELLSKI